MTTAWQRLTKKVVFKVFRALHHAGWTLRMQTQLHPITIRETIQEKSGEGRRIFWISNPLVMRNDLCGFIVFFWGPVLAAASLHQVAFVQQLQCSAQWSRVQSRSGEARWCQHPATSHHCRSVETVRLPSSTDDIVLILVLAHIIPALECNST